MADEKTLYNTVSLKLLSSVLCLVSVEPVILARQDRNEHRASSLLHRLTFSKPSPFFITLLQKVEMTSRPAPNLIKSIIMNII